jgi:hypothetical protein
MWFGVLTCAANDIADRHFQYFQHAPHSGGRVAWAMMSKGTGAGG